VKCPKCSYLGFETGDRCKNCGYDFSLLAGAPAADLNLDLSIRTDDAETGGPELWLDRLDRSMDAANEAAARADHLIGIPPGPPATLTTTPDPSLPLFNPDDPDDIPLIALPVAPRPPLAVRRTPPSPRLRAVPRVSRGADAALNFFAEEGQDEAPEQSSAPADTSAPAERIGPGTPRIGGRRVVAAIIDLTILFAIDLAVIYFTLRMAGLDAGAIRALPAAPLLTFLLLLKFAYFTAFTAMGGQTIGKMTVGIRVIGDRGRIDGGRAIQRTLVAWLSIATFGLGFLPAFLGSDRRTLHDRLTHTRVVGLPSA